LGAVEKKGREDNPYPIKLNEAEKEGGKQKVDIPGSVQTWAPRMICAVERETACWGKMGPREDKKDKEKSNFLVSACVSITPGRRPVFSKESPERGG